MRARGGVIAPYEPPSSNDLDINRDRKGHPVPVTCIGYILDIIRRMQIKSLAAWRQRQIIKVAFAAT